MIEENIAPLAAKADDKVQEYKKISKHLRGILKAEAVEGIDLTQEQKVAALNALTALEAAAGDTSEYMAVRNATEPVEIT